MSYEIQCNRETVFFTSVEPNLYYIKDAFGLGNYTFETRVPVDELGYGEEDILELRQEGAIDELNCVVEGRLRFTLARNEARKLRTIIDDSPLEHWKTLYFSVEERHSQYIEELQNNGQRGKADLALLKGPDVSSTSKFMILWSAEYLVRFVESHPEQEIFTFLAEFPYILAEWMLAQS